MKQSFTILAQSRFQQNIFDLEEYVIYGSRAYNMNNSEMTVALKDAFYKKAPVNVISTNHLCNVC